MAGGEIRSKEARVQITVNGVRLGGSFATIHDISIKPDAQIAKKRFTGEARARGDLDVQGYDGNFKSEMRDHVWWQLWKLISEAERNRQPLPDVVLTMSYGYRDGAGTVKNVGLSGDFTLKLDETNIPQNGYLMASWSFFCSDSTDSQA